MPVTFEIAMLLLVLSLAVMAALTDLSGKGNRKGFAKLLLRSWDSSVRIVTKLVARRLQEWGRLSAEYMWPFQSPIYWVLGTVSIQYLEL
jgi:hypothetical protein